MKIAIVADIQFRMQARYSRDVGARLSDIKACGRWIINEAMRRKCKQLVICGDLFDDRDEVPVPVLSAVGAFVAEASVWFDLVYLVPGNHDCYTRDCSVTSLAAFSAGHKVRVIDRRIVHPCGESSLVFVPWSDDASGITREIRKAARERGPEKTYLFAHALLAGRGGSGGIKESRLLLDRFDGVFFGDVHTPDDIYIGAPMQFDFGDAGSPRGFKVLNVATGKVEYVENKVSPRFHKGEIEREDVKQGDFVRTDDASAFADSEDVWVETVSEETAVLAQVDSPKKAIIAYVRENAPKNKRKRLIGIMLEAFRRCGN